jgi:hypothetical protein
MRIPCAQHAAGPWRIAAIAPDFELIDAWALPIVGRERELGGSLVRVGRAARRAADPRLP